MSLSTMFGKRRTVNMSEEIAEELNKLANSQGKTLYSLINEIGLAALESSRHGFTLNEAIQAKMLVDRAKRSRMVLVNQDLWYSGSSKAYKTSKNEWLKQVYENAKWHARVLLNNNSQEEFIASIKKTLSDFAWDCTETTIEPRGSEGIFAKLVFVPEMSLEHTKSLFKTFEGMFNVFGYVVTDHVVKPGFLTILFKKLIAAIEMA
jgi:hypothetical protein